jgi:hypothetical protein
MKTLKKITSKLALLGLALASVGNGIAATGTITNPTSAGTVWKDTGGADIVNFCGNVLQVGSTFYWYGWDKYAHTVNCYTSTTLGSNSWTEVTGTGFPLFGSGFHGRPDVIYNASTAKYVMVVEFSSPVGRNGIEYLTSSSPTGPFTSVLKEDYVLGTITMGDKGLFQDDDGTAYLLCTSDDGGNANGTHKIVKLNSNYLGQNTVMQSWTVSTNRREALAMVKRNGTYYMTSSATAGWNSSETWYKTATSISGTWTGWQVMGTSPSSTTSYNTQHDFVLKVTGSQTTSYIYGGDRWSQDTGVGFGRNAWYLVTFNGSGVPTIDGDDTWTIDPVTGQANGATQQTATFNPTKDATAKEHFPDTTYGTEAILQVSNQTSYRKNVYLQFNVTGLPAGATIVSAQLKLRSQTTGTGRSITAHTVSNTTWGETTITWNNKPALGASLSTVSSHTSGADSVWTVTSAIAGNGNVTLGLDGTYSGDTSFSSRESADDPVLVVVYQP